MQTEVPVLPIVDSNGHKRCTRKTNGEAGSSIESKNHTQCKSAQFLISNRKHLNPILGAPYKNSMRLHCVSEPTRRPLKNPVGQRIISAKTLRVKELQNQLTDAHYHLNELANENRLLKALQKRQDSALKRYEGANAELPRIINSHHEELKVLQTKYKRLRSQHKQTCDLLKEKDNEIHTLQTQNKHLLQLSKDRHLGEREKLQMQVSDLNHRIEQQQETIQNLNRKLSLESKSLKHQLHVEATKHKETQKQLNEALDKLKNLEELLDNREKRLYHSGQLPAFNKRKALTSQSLTNLGLSHLIKSSSKSRDSQSDFKNKSLPKLPVNDSSDSKPSSSKTEVPDLPRTETMASLHQIRKFRLQKSSQDPPRALTDRLPLEEGPEASKNPRNAVLNHSVPTDMHKLYDRLDSQDLADDEIKHIMHNFEPRTPYRTSKDLLKEYGYSTDTESENLEEEEEEEHLQRLQHPRASPTSKSRHLHSKLINGSLDNQSLHLEDAFHDLKAQRLESKLYRRVRRDSEVKDVETTSGSDSEPEKTTKPEASRLRKIEESNPPVADIENSQERLLSITKSWTDLQHRIKRGREASEAQLNSLENSPETEESTSRGKEDKLLRYFEREEEVEQEIYESHDKSRRGTFGLERSQFSDNQLSVKNGYNESDSVTNGECSPGETPEVGRRKSSDGVVEADISSFRGKNPGTSIPSAGKIDGDSADDKLGDKVNDKGGFNKERLLAAMKAIDDNENIEFISNQKTNQRGNSSVRSQVTENLYRGLPTHARKRDDIIKDIFSDAKVDNKLRSGCTVTSRLTAD
ncbi:myosin-J heavy chain [Diachasma alloeum]|uniref:myosin-J heavy chain n=1 Tax=Diachasma alloeum TaxID=454923 RepID=UPI0007381A2F|nr:myosin-J heavy chain [Diachasma alloeum]